MLAEEVGAFERIQSNLLVGTKEGAASRDSGCLSAHRCAGLGLRVGRIAGQARSQGRSECSRKCWWFVVAADIVDPRGMG